MDNRLRILQVNHTEFGGGPGQVASTLIRMLRARGHEVWYAVGLKTSDDPGSLSIRHAAGQPPWPALWWRIHDRVQRLTYNRFAWADRLHRILPLVAQPRALGDVWRGHENFHFPGSYTILDLPPRAPHILHMHLLQWSYFDLRALPALSARVPTVLTMHDAWLLSGHCAHSFGCERWRTGCGACPDLTIPPRILRDGTAFNWQRKREIFSRSRLWVCTPCQWLMDKVSASMLHPIGAQVIPLGINVRVFSPGDQRAARARLGLPPGVPILLFVAFRPQTNPWKGYDLLLKAFQRLRARLGDDPPLLVVVGGADYAEQVDPPGVTTVRVQRDPAVLADYYRAADVFVYPSRADTFPIVVLEAMACGLPVVAARVGGIPEQVQNGATGYLVPPEDVDLLVERTAAILQDPALQRAMRQRSAEVAQAEFDEELMASRYVDLYRAMLAAPEPAP